VTQGDNNEKIIILTAIIVLVLTGLSFAAQKTITKYMRAGDMGSSITLNPGDFVTNDPTGAMSGDLAHNNLSLAMTYIILPVLYLWRRQ